MSPISLCSTGTSATSGVAQRASRVLPERVLAFPIALRALEMRDAQRVQLLAGEREVAETTAQIPHPYPDGAAQEWIASQRGSRGEHSYAITLSEDGLLIG